MIWLKILAPIFSIVFGTIQLILSKKWSDRRTKKYQIIRFCIYTLFILSIITTIIIVINDNNEAKDLKRSLSQIQLKLDKSEKIQKSNDDLYKQDRKSLIKNIAELNKSLMPFIAIAKSNYPFEDISVSLNLLAQEIKVQSGNINAILNYSDVSKLDMNGKTNNYSAPLFETTPISELLNNAITIGKDNRVTFNCDPDAYKLYNQIIDKYPTFPFTYYFLACCLYQNGDLRWKGYALKAIEIFEKTTKLNDHNLHHDFYLKELKEMIKKK